MITRNQIALSIGILVVAALFLLLPTGVRNVFEHNLWTLAAAEAAFGNMPAPTPPINPHPHVYNWLVRFALRDGDHTAVMGWLSYLEDQRDIYAMDAYAWVNFQDGLQLNAIHLWQDIGYIDRLVNIAQEALDDDNLELSLQARRAAYELNPEEQTIAYANILLKVGKYAEVETLLLEAINSNPTADQRVSWWRNLGDFYRDQGDWIKAQDAYRNALSINPDDRITWLRLGWLIYNETGNAEAAISNFKEIIRVVPERGVGYYAIGQLLLREEQPEKAVEWLRKASENEPASLNNLLAYANLLRDIGQFELAFIEYEKAMNGWPDSWYPHDRVAQAYWLNDQPDNAISAIERAIELSPKNVGVYMRAGQMYEEVGRIDQALAAYLAVLAIEPNRSAAQRGVERLTSGE